MIEVSNVSKSFGKNAAVDNISFTVKKGEKLILLGVSGCGKTTTLKMLNKLIDVSSGTISIDGTDIQDQPAEKLRRNMGYVLQRNSLFPHFTVLENIAVVPNLLYWEKSRIDERAKVLLEKFHLPQERLLAYPKELSGGEAQRVNLARALAADPPILLMDEPFSALDTITRKAMRNEFVELGEFKEKTIVMVTHDVQEAFEIGDRICLMDGGKIIQIGTPKQLLFAPINDFVRDFLSNSYLQLLLTVTRCCDIWKFLDDNQQAANENDKAFSAEISVAAALERFKDKNDTDQKIRMRCLDSVKMLSVSDLLQGFANYKAKTDART
ncbi:ABC transporter ATP-binding protein [Flavobacterium noncentrifugens]|uniref:Osmoprotectant transport system ATP-binding protein n=1 Tax=Flavobacterium noncentrifugens TaxID=1128970 RepID=A0A1G8URZ5_9FLAO|nr:ABC transporter ATP-binding protein [Flavobacterium noncentrifugens]GEP52595.1 ABC transporter ATP-binding protein [Flavobacterium noncentrifugens]SDJ56636.1 osmoprotectant transport system ATP-binding protein [Flavobacterium noncentrifugens]